MHHPCKNLGLTDSNYHFSFKKKKHSLLLAFINLVWPTHKSEGVNLSVHASCVQSQKYFQVGLDFRAMIDVYSMQSTDGTEVSLKQRTNNLPETEGVVALLAFALHRKPQGSDSIGKRIHICTLPALCASLLFTFIPNNPRCQVSPRTAGKGPIIAACR
jgi:hypothetical protein